jgi:hypothetical protein
LIPLILAGVVAAGGQLHPLTLAGVTLGSNIARVLSQHPTAQKAADSSAHWWTWSVDGGGTVIVTADDNGNINRVDFIADKGATNSIDLPCAGLISVQDLHVHLERALKTTPCTAYNGAAYGVPGGSVVDVRFSDFDADPLVEATWYHPSVENPSPVGQLRAIVGYVRPVLKGVGGAARVYYAGECSGHDYPMRGILFPSVYLQPAQGATGVTAIRQIFRDDPKVSVAQDRSGMVRITVGSVSTALLQARIPRISLTPNDQYTVLSAVDQINVTADAYAAKMGLGYSLVPFLIDHLIQLPVDGLPHLPATMQNVTLDETLDVVARTFKGVSTYGECKMPDGGNLFHLGYFYGSH